MHHNLKGQNFNLENVRDTLGKELFLKLKEVEGSVMLDHSLFGYFECCRQVSDILA